MNQALQTLLSLIFLFFSVAQAQTVQTIVGSGAGFDDDMILDSAGNIYVSSYDLGAIYKILPGGAVSTYVSGLSASNGLAWDGQNNIVVCDNLGDMIYKIGPDTTLSPFYAVNSPSGIIKDPLSDTLYFTQYQGHRIWKLAPDTTAILFAQSNGLNGPVGLDWDEQNRLIVANFGNSMVFRFSRSGVMDTIGQYPFSGAIGFIAYQQGYIYGTSFNSHRIFRMDTSGVSEWVAGSGAAGQVDGPTVSARFNRPNGIIFSRGGDSLYISEYGSESLRMITGLDSIGFVGIRPGNAPGLDMQIAPVPTSGIFRVQFELPEGGEISLRIIDMQGRGVYQREVGYLSAGKHVLPFEQLDLPAGTYVLWLEGDGFRAARKLTIAP